MIKGLTLLDAAMDTDGSYIPGKTTIVICSSSTADLKLLLGFINSQLASFYIKQKYSSASYNGGVNFTPDMLNSLPISNTIDRDSIINLVEIILDNIHQINKSTTELYKLIRSSTQNKIRKNFEKWYELTDQEFIVELNRNSISTTLKQRSEWLDHFNTLKATTCSAVNKLTSAKSEINNQIFEAYSLSKDEIRVIQDNC